MNCENGCESRNVRRFTGVLGDAEYLCEDCIGAYHRRKKTRGMSAVAYHTMVWNQYVKRMMEVGQEQAEREIFGGEK